MNVLVVDDEFEMRLLVTSLLLREGWNVETAENGQDALTKMERKKFDLVISDVYMPVMDGVQLHEALRASPGHEKVPFLFVSAYDDEHTLRALGNPSLDGFVRKGTAVSELMARIQDLTIPADKKGNTSSKLSS